MRAAKLCILLFLLACLMAALHGCAVYDVAMEERNAGDWANDNRIALTIEKDFLADDNISYLDFSAYSYEGHVYLVGEYDNRSQVNDAVAIARAVDGARTVTTYMLPKRAEDHCGTTDNLGIYTALKKELVADGDIWSTNIDIDTIQCNVVLMGIVGSAKEKAKAETYAKAIKGVRQVKSYLRVK